MNEELKRRAEIAEQGLRLLMDDPASAAVIRDLLAECKRLNICLLYAEDAAEKGRLARENASAMEARIAELEQHLACPKCGTSSQVWRNQITGLLTCHRAGCHTELEQPKPDPYQYARRLAESMWRNHYAKDAPGWQPFDDLYGVLSQIDNMLTGLVRDEQPKSEPVAWPNGCDQSVPEALRYLADHERPNGGCDRFNSEHLFQLAREIESMASRALYTAPPAIPEGYALVPIEPTPEMLSAAYLEAMRVVGSKSDDMNINPVTRRLFAAMLAAAKVQQP